MGVLLTLIAAMVVWLVLWGVSIMKSFDAFMIAIAMVLVAASLRVVLPYLPGGKD